MSSSDAPPPAAPKKMEFKPTSKDEKILGYICKNFSCKICNSILIQCVTLSCGHQYCNYCLDMLTGGKSTSPQQSSPCPQCSSPIKYAQPNDGIDQKIDNLIHSCSKPIHKAYTVALNNRFQKSLERSRKKHEARIQHHQNSLQNGDDDKDGEEDSSKISGSSFDDICKALLDSANGSTAADSEQSLAEVLKSAAGKQGKGKIVTPRVSTSRKGSHSSRRPPLEIDIDKVNSLFGIYDHILQHGGKESNEPKKELAGGDFAREEDINALEPLDGMKNFTRKSDLELTALIKEADDIIRLDDHIQQWAKRMKVALGGSSESDVAVNSSSEVDDESGKHNVKDELWKSSNQLLRKLKGLQSQRQEVLSRLSLHLPTLPPPPRSAKLDLGMISDDSDVEEYEEALLNLQDSMKNQFIPKPEDLEAETSSPPPNADTSAGGNEQKCSRRRRGSLDFVEESAGLLYIKENIQFIGQMRKYKEALMKIQNREVETAQEIKELLPFRESTGDGGQRPTSAGNNLKAKPHTSPAPSSKSSRPRVAHYSPMRAPSPTSQAQQKQRPPQFSARLTPSPLPSRPRTASSSSYETRPSSSTSTSSSPFHHQLLPKLYMKRSRGGNGTGSIYTAR